MDEKGAAFAVPKANQAWRHWFDRALAAPTAKPWFSSKTAKCPMVSAQMHCGGS